MAHKVLHESKHILRRVAIGAVTSILITTILYFLYNRNTKPTENEIRKETIEGWKRYVTIENNSKAAWDTSKAIMDRTLDVANDTTRNVVLNAFCARDSTISQKFLKEIELIRASKELDRDFRIMLDARVAYLAQQTDIALRFTRRLQAVMDSSITLSEMVEITQDFGNLTREKQASILLRIGRNLEYFSEVLTRKYKYPFASTDLNLYPYYRSLKKTKVYKPEGDVAPPDPNNAN